jgi:hypothetical protein
MIIDVAASILKKNKTPIFKTFFDYPILIGTLMECLLNNSANVRCSALSFFAVYLSSSHPELG